MLRSFIPEDLKKANYVTTMLAHTLAALTVPGSIFVALQTFLAAERFWDYANAFLILVIPPAVTFIAALKVGVMWDKKIEKALKS